MIELERLWISEFGPGASSIASLLLEPALHSAHGFAIRTCQRMIWISTQPFRSEVARQNLSGHDAYAFLLRFACGLESEIKGETDVFGQVKTAFKNLASENPSLSRALQPVTLKLFEDTKEIRAEYLQGIGGNTYGALSRRVLDPQPSDRVLLMGAGQISKSVAPYFAEFSLQIWNRSSQRLQELSRELSEKGYSNLSLIQDHPSLVQAIENATILLLATPAGAETDELVIRHGLNGSDRFHKKILHLGGQAQDTQSFKNYPHFWSLTDLFAIEKEQNLFREKQVQQAMDACHHRAILRNMSRSVSLSHGWEDLALFY